MDTILVAIDLSDATLAVLRAAKEMATAFKGRIVLLHVIQPIPPLVAGEMGPSIPTGVGAEFVAEEVEASRRRVEDIGRQLREQGFDVTAVATEGSPADGILDEARHCAAELIVLGSHGHGALYHLLLGSVSTAVVRRAGCPVLVVPVRAKVAPAQSPPAAVAT